MKKFDSSIVLCNCGHTARQHTDSGCSSCEEGANGDSVGPLCNCGMSMFDVINDFVNDVFDEFGITIGEHNESS